MTTTAALSLSHLSTGYGSHIVSRDICADLPRGSLTCLIGPNGAGKSTLLRTIAGFQPPLHGHISYTPFSRFLSLSKELPAAKQQHLSRILSIVLTDNSHIHGLSVRDVVGLGRTPYTPLLGGLSAADTAIVDSCLQRIGISHLADRMIHTLSDGERQKVMIAKAIAQQTDIILLDEPTSFLYYPDKVHTLQLLRDIAVQEHKAILCSTHEIELVLELADFVWFIHSDRLQVLPVGELVSLYDNSKTTHQYEKIVSLIDALSEHHGVCSATLC